MAVGAVAGWKAERAFEGDQTLFGNPKHLGERGVVRIEQKQKLKQAGKEGTEAKMLSCGKYNR